MLKTNHKEHIIETQGVFMIFMIIWNKVHLETQTKQKLTKFWEERQIGHIKQNITTRIV